MQCMHTWCKVTRMCYFSIVLVFVIPGHKTVNLATTLGAIGANMVHMIKQGITISSIWQSNMVKNVYEP